eukprot:jgi/Pico_ML_1/53429/g3970.t1
MKKNGKGKKSGKKKKKKKKKKKRKTARMKWDPRGRSKCMENPKKEPDRQPTEKNTYEESSQKRRGIQT